MNYVLDEFSSLPTINDFPAMITAARSRNIRFNLFIQSKHQLKLRYQEECDTIMSNCENWIFLTSKELEILRDLSELCGTTNGVHSKPLLSITDLQRFDKHAGESLIMNGINKPFISNLADIDFYDLNKYARTVVKKRELRRLVQVDFSLPAELKNELFKIQEEVSEKKEFSINWHPNPLGFFDNSTNSLDEKLAKLGADKGRKKEDCGRNQQAGDSTPLESLWQYSHNSAQLEAEKKAEGSSK